MIAKWKKHCPYDSDENPTYRQAWRKGWFYRKNHRPIAREIKRRWAEGLPDSPLLQGYYAADEHLEDAMPVVQQ